MAQVMIGVRMPGPAPRPLDERRRALADRLGPAVVELLSSGLRYRDLAIEQIVAGAGIARSTFYAHFADKSDLLVLLSHDTVDDIVAMGGAWTQLPSDASIGDLYDAMVRIVTNYRSHRELMEALPEEAAHDRRVRGEFERMYTLVRQVLSDHVRAGQDRGSVDSRVDPEATVAWLTAMMDRGVYLHVRHGTDDERSLRALAEIIWSVLYRNAPLRAAQMAEREPVDITPASH